MGADVPVSYLDGDVTKAANLSLARRCATDYIRVAIGANAINWTSPG